MIKTCYNNGQKERLCLIIDKCRRQKLCKRAQKISAAAPLRVMASRYNPCEQASILGFIELEFALEQTIGLRNRVIFSDSLLSV